MIDEIRPPFEGAVFLKIEKAMVPYPCSKWPTRAPTSDVTAYPKAGCESASSWPFSPFEMANSEKHGNLRVVVARVVVVSRCCDFHLWQGDLAEAQLLHGQRAKRADG